MPGIPLEELMVRLSVEGQEKLKAQLGEVDTAVTKVGASVTATAAKTQTGTKATKDAGEAAVVTGRNFSAMNVPILNVALAITAAAYAAERLGRGLFSGSGLQMAALTQGAEFSLGKLSGSMEQAGGIMAIFRQEAADSPFRRTAAELSEYARALIATGSTAEDAARKVKIFEDVAASTGDPGLTEKLSQAYARVRAEPHAGIRQLISNFENKGIDIKDILFRGSGMKARNSEQAGEMLSSMYGPKAAEIIMKGLESAFHGSAMDRIKNTFTGSLNSIANITQQIMEPTGKLLLVALEPVGGLIRSMADLANWMNKGTGGVLGLVTAGYGLYRVKTLLIGSYNAAIMAINRLTLSLTEMAAASNIAAGSAKVNAAANAQAATTNAASTAKNYAAAAAGGVGGAAAWWARVKYGGPNAAGVQPMGPYSPINMVQGPNGVWSAAKASPVPGVAARVGQSLSRLGPLMMLGAGVSAFGDYVGGKTGNLLSNIGGGIGIGALGGAAIGAMGGPIGAAGGAAIGALIGLGKGIYENTHESKSSEQQIVENTAKTADYLQELRGQLIGGGPNSRRTMGQLEIEQSLMRMMIKGGGI